jgi:type III restriction enzyme
MLAHPDVQRKRRAAIAWCDRINELAEEKRSGREWHYVLIGEALFYDFRKKGASLAEVLDFARLRAKPAETGSLI